MDKQTSGAHSALSKMKTVPGSVRKWFSGMPLPLLIPLIASLFWRFLLINFQSGDYTSSLSVWYDFIRENGGFSALKEPFHDYNMPYLYLLTAATYLPLKKLYAIKLLSIFFDYVLAAAGACAVYSLTSDRLKSGFAFFAILFLPTVLLNSAYWGQSDAIFASFAVLSVALLAANRVRPACIFFGVALSFKLQAIFIAPLFVVYFLRKTIRFRELLWIPAMLIVALLPAIAVGKPVKDALHIYVHQAGAYKFLTMQAPNLYQWLPNSQFEIFYKAGLFFAFAVTTAFVLLAGLRKKNSGNRTDDALLWAAFFALLLPFVLPTMHERYFFLADILSLLLAITRPGLWPLPILVVSSSLFSYFPFLFGPSPVSLKLLPFALIAALALLLPEIIRPEKSLPITTADHGGI